jgi:hypothetical protein
MSPLLVEDHIEVGVSLLRILRVDQMVVDQKVVDQMIVDQMAQNVYNAVVLNTGVKDL